MSSFVISNKYPCFADELSKMGHNVIFSDTVKAFPQPEQAHADMQILTINNTVFVLQECEKLKTLPLTNKNARDFVRFFLSGAGECEIDKQGRFLLPNNLRTYAKLEKEINIIGVGTRIEIWNRENWKNYSSSENISADEIAENMTMLGI